jgi:D-glycerate 3-kinase
MTAAMGITERCLAFVRDELGIAADFSAALTDVYEPLARGLVERGARQSAPLIVGVAGAQGSGKTTAAAILRILLAELGVSVAAFSLDDLYLPLVDRERLRAANPRDPYQRVRGNPGSHDAALGALTIERLRNADPASVTALPAFDKSLHDGQGDRLPESAWPVFRGRPDAIIFEGWFVGAVRLPDEELAAHLAAAPEAAAFVARHDPTGEFTRAVNRRLDAYRPLFALLDVLVYLAVPSVQKIFEWRRLQEQKLREKTGRGLTDAQVDELVESFLPVTAVHGLRMLARPAAERLVIEIGDDHAPRPRRGASANSEQRTANSGQ